MHRRGQGSAPSSLCDTAVPSAVPHGSRGHGAHKKPASSRPACCFPPWLPAPASAPIPAIMRSIQTHETAQMLKNKPVLKSVAELACFA